MFAEVVEDAARRFFVEVHEIGAKPAIDEVNKQHIYVAKKKCFGNTPNRRPPFIDEYGVQYALYQTNMHEPISQTVVARKCCC